MFARVCVCRCGAFSQQINKGNKIKAVISHWVGGGFVLAEAWTLGAHLSVTPNKQPCRLEIAV